MDSKSFFDPPQPCSITMVGKGPLPVGGRVTSRSSGTPSKGGPRVATVPPQKGPTLPAVPEPRTVRRAALVSEAPRVRSERSGRENERDRSPTERETPPHA